MHQNSIDLTLDLLIGSVQTNPTVRVSSDVPWLLGGLYCSHLILHVQ